jgi:hypothetical protein
MTYVANFLQISVKITDLHVSARKEFPNEVAHPHIFSLFIKDDVDKFAKEQHFTRHMKCDKVLS